MMLFQDVLTVEKGRMGMVRFEQDLRHQTSSDLLNHYTIAQAVHAELGCTQ